MDDPIYFLIFAFWYKVGWVEKLLTKSNNFAKRAWRRDKKVYNYIRPEFYTQNEDKVRQLISCVLEEYKLGKIDYIEAKKRSYEKIYQSVDASFDYDAEFAKDTCYRNIPSVDNSLFTIARKLILAERTPV